MKKIALFIVVVYFMSAPISSRASTVTTNTLSIPSIGVTQNIVESDTIHGVGNYVWHRPNTPSPDPRKGNPTFVAHRVINIPFFKQGTFYKLPEVKTGDTITLNWNGRTYTYEVFETKVVTPDHLEVEFTTEKPIITLYTCVYNLSGKDRFVVHAKLVSSGIATVTQ